MKKDIVIICLCFICWAFFYTLEPKTEFQLLYPVAAFLGAIMGNAIIVFVLMLFYKRIYDHKYKEEFKFWNKPLIKKIKVISVAMVLSGIIRLLIAFTPRITGDIGIFLGITIGTFFISYLLSLLFRIITKVDTIKQRAIATSIVTFLCILSISLFNKQDSFYTVLGFIVFCLLAWLIIISFFALGLRIKQLFAALIYGIILWVVAINLIVVLLTLFHLIDKTFVAIFSIIILGISFVISTLLTFQQKLPFTKVIPKAE